MGGGGTHYSRDVQDGYARTTRGTSTFAEKELTRESADPVVFPLGRTISCSAESPIVLACDDTGSMDVLPKIYWDKMPLIVGQIAERQYLKNPMASISVVGDLQQGDRAPIQVGDFCEMRHIDDWLKRIWLEGGGRGNHLESYEHMAYFYARRCNIPNAKTPFFIFTGDEGFYDILYESDLKRTFGGDHETVESAQIFKELREKFFGNVFLIHRRYQDSDWDQRIVHQWQGVLGNDHVIKLRSDQAIGDVTLGLFAIVSGSRTLDQYAEDLKTKRDVPQTDDRVREVRESLSLVKPMQIPKAKEADIVWL